MKDLEEWCPPADQEKGFRLLRELSIDSCPKLANVSHRFTSLKILKINNCGSLAAFSSSHDCPLLESLEIEGCMKLSGLPRFERLRKLRLLESNDELFMHQAREVEGLQMSNDKVGPGQLVSLEELVIGTSCGDLPVQMFPNLEAVEFYKCLHLQKVPDQLSRLQSLRELTLEECSEMVSFPDGGLPSMLKRLKITCCLRLETIPEGVLGNSNLLEDMEIRRCSSLASFDGKLPTSLKSLSISECSSLQSLPQLQGLMSLVRLDIEGCHSLTSFPTTGSGFGGGGDLPITLESLRIRDCDKLRSLPQSLPNLSSLRYLEVGSCPLVEHFPIGGLPTTSLETFDIYDCPIVRRLPEGIQGCSSLKRLSIDRCTSFDSLPQLPRALKYLGVRRCESLGPIEDWGLDGLESLDEFVFGDISSLESLEHVRLPKSITLLYLSDLPNLKTISNGLKNLTSLRELWIEKCVNLKSLPDEEGLPETLGCLWIRNCPLLKRRCERRGADWSKFADLPSFEYFDD